VLVTGEAGMGKTSVLNALARDAADAGAQVLFGSCMSMEDPRHCCRGRRWFGRG
jgi:anion-transporting  ArsA/GET3 family ATPase